MAANDPMVSEVSICNQALLWLGQETIISFDDPSTTAEWCRNNYPFIRDAVLESRMWTFATSRAKSSTANLDAWGQEYSHNMPVYWISVFRVYRDVSNNTHQPIEWRREGNKILCSEANIFLWGLVYITDTGRFSPLFVQALAARIAADAAIPLTENRQLQADMWGLYNDKLSEAAARDGQQGTSDTITQSRLTGVRRTGGAWINSGDGPFG